MAVVWKRDRRTLRPASAVSLAAWLLVLAGVAFAQSGGEVRVNTASSLVRAALAGGVVTIEPGAYTVPDTLVLRGEVELRAEEAGTVRLDLRGAPVGVSVEPDARVRITRVGLAYDADEPGDVLRVDDATATLVEADVAFAVAGGNATPERPSGYGSGMVLTGAADVTVVGGGFGRHGGYAIEVLDRATLRLEDVVVVNNGAGIHVDGEARLAMSGGEVRSHEGSALHVRGKATASLTSTSLEDSGSLGGTDVDAVRVDDDAEAEFHEVVFAYHPRFALTLRGRATVRSYGSLFEHNGSDAGAPLISAVWVGDGAELVLQGDDFRDHPGGAIEAAGAARVTLEGVTIERTGSWAHTYVVERAQVRVRGGRFADNEGAFFVGDSAEARLDEVEMVDGAGEAVIADGEAQVSIRGGRIVGHASFGVYLAGAVQVWVDDTVIAGNRSGLVASDASWLRVEGAEVRDNEHSGVAFLDAASGEVRGSLVSGNPWSGVVAAGGTFVEVIGSVLDGNAERGAWFDEGSSGIFRDNTVRGSAVGVEIAEGASSRLGDNVFEDVGEAVVMHGSP